MKYQAWTWDAITSISDEVEVFMGRSIAMIDIIYILSRYLISNVSLPLTVYFILRSLMGLAIYIAFGTIGMHDLQLRYPPIDYSFFKCFLLYRWIVIATSFCSWLLGYLSSRCGWPHFFSSSELIPCTTIQRLQRPSLRCSGALQASVLQSFHFYVQLHLFQFRLIIYAS